MSRSYRRRLEQDLDRWIALGLVDRDRREAILAASAGDRTAPLSAAAALSLSGAALMGLAAIAFVAANWEAIPRLARLGLILGLLWGALAGAIWAGERRVRAREGFAILAALTFAAGTGIVGQMYHLPGEPWQAMAAAAAGAIALAFAARSRAAVLIAYAFGVWSYGLSGAGFGDAGPSGGEAALVALGALGAWRARLAPSRLLTHATLLYAGAVVWIVANAITPEAARLDGPSFGPATLLTALVWIGVGVAARAWGSAPVWRGWSSLAFGYAGYFGLLAFAIWGFEVRLTTVSETGVISGEGAQLAFTLVHRALWLGASIGLVALGRAERAGWVTAAGVGGAIGASLALLNDLGLDLLQIAGLFFLFAIIALAAAFAVARRRERAS